MADVRAGLDAQIRNIEATYGRSMADWFAIIDASGLAKHTDVVAMLKRDYGLAQGAAHRVSLTHRNRDTSGGPDDIADPADRLYLGRKAALRPIHDAVIKHLRSLGSDIEIVPKKGYVSLRRTKQFAMLQPSTTTRVDLGLILPGIEPDGRLEDARTFNALFTHRVRLANLSDVDADVRKWLRHAYARTHS